MASLENLDIKIYYDLCYCQAVIGYLLRSLSLLLSPFSSYCSSFHDTRLGKQQPTGHSERHCPGEQEGEQRMTVG